MTAFSRLGGVDYGFVKKEVRRPLEGCIWSITRGDEIFMRVLFPPLLYGDFLDGLFWWIFLKRKQRINR